MCYVEFGLHFLYNTLYGTCTLYLYSVPVSYVSINAISSVCAKIKFFCSCIGLVLPCSWEFFRMYDHPENKTKF